jgi:ribose 5-phosphate isomerase B
MKVAIASDHAGIALKAVVRDRLREAGHEVADLGPEGVSSVDYPDFALNVSKLVASGVYRLGVLICGTGIGMSIAANKVPGIRAALCANEYMARMARRHNDANVLAIGARVIGQDLASAIAEEFVKTDFEGGRHEGRLKKISDIERCRQ